jgi:hypothetical protein
VRAFYFVQMRDIHFILNYTYLFIVLSWWNYIFKIHYTSNVFIYGPTYTDGTVHNPTPAFLKVWVATQSGSRTY